MSEYWHESADPNLLTPLAIINGHSFFVFEPCLLTNGHAVIPYRWFVCGKSILARVWPLCLVQHDDSTGWIVEGFKTDIVSQDELLVPFRLWVTSHLADGLPDAACIIGALLYVPS